MLYIYRMKQILCVLFAVVVQSCIGQTIRPDLDALAKEGIDPYFVVSRDTISIHGPDHITRDLLQDRNGNYWFATWLGIIRYDGHQFINYTLKENLIHFHVVSTYEDKKGNLWFGTARGGLYKYDGKSFRLLTTSDGLIYNTVTSFAEDEKGNIWMGTEKGISRYNGKSFTNFTKEDGLRGNNVAAILVDQKGKLWIGCAPNGYNTQDGGISCYDGKSFTDFNNENGLPFKNVIALLEDSAGNIWIGQFDGLTIYDGTSFTDVLSDFLTYYMIEAKNGDIWLSHSELNPFYENVPNQVLYRYNATSDTGIKTGTIDSNRFIRIMEKYESNDFQIFGKIEDRGGNIWFGTMHGPCRYDGIDFTYFTE